MGIGSKLSKLLELNGTNANELANKIGVSPQTIYSIIKRDSKKADIEVLLKIADELGVTAEYFVYDEIPTITKKCNTFSNEIEKLSTPEYRIIEKYRGLDRHGQKIVDFILNEEHERSMTLIPSICDLDDIPDTFEEMEKKLVKESIRSDVG